MIAAQAAKPAMTSRARGGVLRAGFGNRVRGAGSGRPDGSSVARLGLVSAYHVSRGVEAGNEPEPTFYWRRRAVDGYHIDYVFMPEDWSTHAFDVAVGTYEDWVGSGLSDHVPLVLEMARPRPLGDGAVVLPV